jgi:hypothetical protein
MLIVTHALRSGLLAQRLDFVYLASLRQSEILAMASWAKRRKAGSFIQ